jgi:hypothetical protein
MMATAKKPRVRECEAHKRGLDVPGCAETFEKRRMGQKVCAPKCAIAVVNDDKRREKDRSRRKEVLETKRVIREGRTSWWQSIGSDCTHHGGSAAYWFHRWVVKVRDAHKPCIYCGATEPKGGKWDACHGRSRQAAGHLRFHEDNVHKGCTHCNTATTGDSGAKYRANQVERIGEDRVQHLETDNTTHHWVIEVDGEEHPLHLRPLRVIRDDYRARCKEAGV